MPVGASRVATTRPYYRSGWVFVTRAEDGRTIHSFDDPALRDLTIGVPVVGEGSDTPALIALGRRVLVNRLVSYSVGGDLGDGDDAPERMIDDLAARKTDVALMWGPSAGYWAARQSVRLSLLPTPPLDRGDIPLAASIAVAVKPGNRLREELDTALDGRREEIAAILAAYHVPRLAE
jgi:mxaJ protein